MGLTERRAVKAFQDKRLPALLKAVNDAAKFEVPVEVAWDQLAVEGQAEHYLEDGYWILTFFRPLAAALSEITFDDIGKEAVQGGLKKVRFVYDPQTAPANDYPEGVAFADGVLTINFVPGVNAGDERSAYYRDRVAAIRKVLETKL